MIASPRVRRAAPSAILLGAALMGCVTRAYQGLERSPGEVATVIGSGYVLAGTSEEVAITSVDGRTEIGDWKAPMPRVDLLPGPARIGVRYQNSKGSVPGPLPAIVGLVDAYRKRPDECTLQIDLEAGYAYVVHTIRNPFGYFVIRYALEELPSRSQIPWDPPWGAVRCDPAEPGGDVLVCDMTRARAPLPDPGNPERP